MLIYVSLNVMLLFYYNIYSSCILCTFLSFSLGAIIMGCRHRALLLVLCLFSNCSIVGMLSHLWTTNYLLHPSRNHIQIMWILSSNYEIRSLQYFLHISMFNLYTFNLHSLLLGTLYLFLYLQWIYLSMVLLILMYTRS